MRTWMDGRTDRWTLFMLAVHFVITEIKIDLEMDEATFH